MVELGDRIDPDLNDAVRALDEALLRAPFPGYVEAIPSYRSLLVFFDPAVTTMAKVVPVVQERFATIDPACAPVSGVKEVLTVYDGEDLDEVAHLAKVSREEVVRLHSEREYRVYVVGFTPGFAYMGMTDDKLALPRRASPRTRVPRGSVAIAMGQTGIYPSDTPGGWHLLGRADPELLFDVRAEPPSRFAPGDRVRFLPVGSLPVAEGPPAGASEHKAVGDVVFEVEQGGLLTTVQDLGRPGYQRFGVPVAGAVDQSALIAANALVGNEENAAGLECTVDGPSLRCVRTTLVGLAGADLGAIVRRRDLGEWRPPASSSFLLRPGNVLSFSGRCTGARAYLSVAGGLDVEPVLGSRSTYLTAGFGGFEGRALRSGDRLRALPSASFLGAGQRRAEPRVEPVVLRIVWGPQDDYFTAGAKDKLVSEEFRVGTAADRMGYRLEGPTLSHRDAREIISDGNALGSIQVPPNGLPIVMLADRATTGGYPKIATVVSSDIGRLAQLMPGDSVRFQVLAATRH